MTDVMVTIKDTRSLKYCSRGIRVFLEKKGLSWADFLKNGIPAEELEKTGDAMAIKAVEVARGRKQ